MSRSCERPFWSRTTRCSPSALALQGLEPQFGVSRSRYFPAPDFLHPASVHTSEPLKGCRISAALITFVLRVLWDIGGICTRFFEPTLVIRTSTPCLRFISLVDIHLVLLRRELGALSYLSRESCRSARGLIQNWTRIRIEWRSHWFWNKWRTRRFPQQVSWNIFNPDWLTQTSMSYELLKTQQRTYRN